MQPHISGISSGLNRPLAYPGVFGYAFCNEMVHSEIAHSCNHGPPPHEILVYLLKGLNKPAWKAVRARLEEDQALLEARWTDAVRARKALTGDEAGRYARPGRG